MKKLYNFRLDANLIKELDKKEGTRTLNVTNALHLYLRHEKDYPSVDKDAVNHLTQHIEFLQGQVTYLQKQNSYLSLGWFKRLLLPKPKE